MSRIIYPFTQIYEDVMKEMRESSTETATKQKYGRRVNHIYMFDIPARYEWPWLRRTSYVSLLAPYDTGTVDLDVSADRTAITGDGTTWTSAMTGYSIKFGDDDEVYTFTYASGTTGTISPAYVGSDDIDGGTYTIYKTKYALPADFSKFPNIEPRVYWYSSGSKTEIPNLPGSDFQKRYTYQENQIPSGWRIAPALTSEGYYQIEFTNPVTDDMTAHIEYIMAQSEMYESTDTGKTGSTTTKLLTTTNMYGKVTAGMYARVDADGEWSRITAVATDTTAGLGITLEGWRVAADNTDPVTFSTVPNMPVTMHQALFYGGCMLTALEQNDALVQGYSTAYAGALDADMAKRSRERYGQKYFKMGGWRK